MLDAELAVLDELGHVALVALEVGQDEQVLAHGLLVAVEEGLVEAGGHLGLQLAVLGVHEHSGGREALVAAQVARQHVQLVDDLGRLLQLRVVREHPAVLDALHELVKVLGDLVRLAQVVPRLVQVLQLRAHLRHGRRHRADVLVQLGQVTVRVLKKEFTHKSNQLTNQPTN